MEAEFTIRPGNDMLLRVALTLATGEPLNGANVTARVVRPDGAEVVPVTLLAGAGPEEPGVYTVVLIPYDAAGIRDGGTYSVEVNASAGPGRHGRWTFDAIASSRPSV